MTDTEISSVTLRVTDSVTYVIGKLNKEIYKEFKNVLGYKDPNAIWRNAKSKDWDGFVTTVCYNKTFCKCSIKKDGVHFPTGLYSKAVDFLRAYCVGVSIIDDRSNFDVNKINIGTNLDFQVRDYQQEIINNASKSQRGIIKVATGGGKCISENSLCLTSKGMLMMGEIGQGLNQGEDKVYETCVSSPLWTSGKDTTSRIYRDGISDSFRIETDYGFHITGTRKHRVMCLNMMSGDFEWKFLPEITTDDYLVLTKGQRFFGNKDSLNHNDAYWLGLLTGDGSIVEENLIRLSASDDHIINFTRQYCSDRGLSLKEYPDKRRKKLYTLSVCNKAYRKLLFDMGLKRDYSLNKTIPFDVRCSPQNIVAAYVRGLYETDGWISYEKCKPTLCIGFSSEKLIDQLQSILLNFGVIASKRKKKTYRSDHFILTIYRDYIPAFMDEIGLDHSGRKFTSLKEAMWESAQCDQNSNSDLAPGSYWLIDKVSGMLRVWLGARRYRSTLAEFGLNSRTVKSWKTNSRYPSRRSLEKFINWAFEILPECGDLIKSYVPDYLMRLQKLIDPHFFFAQVKKIQIVQSDNYDFVVPNGHSFVANGIINHNTAIGAGIIAKIGISPFIFYVTSQDLLRQAKSELERFLNINGAPMKVGIIGGGKCDIQDVNIMTIQTAVRALGEKFHKFDDEDEPEEMSQDMKDRYETISNLVHSAKGMICDEVQHWAADTCQVISDHSVNCRFRYGLSATPWRDLGDDILIDACFGKPIAEINASFLIKQDILVRPTIYFVHTRKKFEDDDISYATAYKEGIVENEERNLLIANIAQNMVKQGRHVLVLAKHIDHGKTLESLTPNSVFLHGSHSAKVRQSHIDLMRSGKAPITIATSIFDEGIDVKPLNGLILAGSGKSQTRALQRIGRVIRTFQDPVTGFSKKDAYIVDFNDNMKYMLGHARARRRIYETEPEFIIKDFKGN